MFALSTFPHRTSPRSYKEEGKKSETSAIDKASINFTAMPLWISSWVISVEPKHKKPSKFLF
jgi:hypothetical protein